MSLDLSVIIVSYNTAALLRQCLTALRAELAALHAEVLVVDNNSADGSATLVAAEFPEARLWAEAANHGFAGGNNLAIAAARGRHVLLLNPDTIVGKGSLATLVGFLDANPAVGAVGARLHHPESRQIELSGRSFPTATGLFFTLSYLDRLFPRSHLIGSYRLTYWNRDEARLVGWVTGACLMVRSSVIASVGMLDTSYFMYGEDVDWCYRIRQAGWEIWFLPAAAVAHYGGQSALNWPQASGTAVRPSAIIQHYDSLLAFARQHYGASAVARFRCAIALGVVVRLVVWSTYALVRGVGEQRVSSYRAALRYLLTPRHLAPQQA